MNPVIAISTVKDGSMYNRNDMQDATVIDNRRQFLKTQGISLHQTMRLRVHYQTDDFCRYVFVDEKHRGEGMTNDIVPPADALITQTPGLALFLPVADCIGAAIYDAEHGVLALAHLGRHSLEQDGGRRIIEHLAHHFDSDPAKLQLWLTPAAGKDVYPLWAFDNKGMKEVVFEQFAAAGVLMENIVDNPAETTNDPNYYSYSEFLKGNRTEDADYAIVAMLRE